MADNLCAVTVYDEACRCNAQQIVNTSIALQHTSTPLLLQQLQFWSATLHSWFNDTNGIWHMCINCHPRGSLFPTLGVTLTGAIMPALSSTKVDYRTPLTYQSTQYKSKFELNNVVFHNIY